MTKWQYAVIYVEGMAQNFIFWVMTPGGEPKRTKVPLSQMYDYLAHLGLVGWELIGSFPVYVQEGFSPYNGRVAIPERLYLKRPLPAKGAVETAE